MTWRTAVTTYRNPKDEDSRVHSEPNPHVAATALYGNRIITAVAECHHRPATRCDAELSRFAVDCFLDAIDKVIVSAASSDEVVLCLERGMLVTQERVRDHMVTSQDEDLSLTVTALVQLRNDVGLPSPFFASSLSSSPSSVSSPSPSSSLSSFPHSSLSSPALTPMPTEGGKGERERGKGGEKEGGEGGVWVALSLGMPNGPIPIVIDSRTNGILSSFALPLAPLSSPSSLASSAGGGGEPSLSTFRLDKLWCSIVPCRPRDVIAFINSDAAVTLDPVYLNKVLSGSDLFSWESDGQTSQFLIVFSSLRGNTFLTISGITYRIN